GRIGVKTEVTPYVGVGTGVGFAVSPSAGNAVAADVGAIFAYDNCYVVPFLSVAGFVSAPLKAETVDIAQPSDMESHPATPRTTFALPLPAGVRTPFEHAACRAGGHARTALLVGGALTPMATSESHDTMLSLGAMVEIGL